MIDAKDIEILSRAREKEPQGGGKVKIRELYFLRIKPASELAYRTRRAMSSAMPKRKDYFAEDEADYQRDMKDWQNEQFRTLSDWAEFFGIISDKEKSEFYFSHTGDGIYAVKVNKYRQAKEVTA